MIEDNRMEIIYFSFNENCLSVSPSNVWRFSCLAQVPSTSLCPNSVVIVFYSCSLFHWSIDFFSVVFLILFVPYKVMWIELSLFDSNMRGCGSSIRYSTASVYYLQSTFSTTFKHSLQMLFYFINLFLILSLMIQYT